MLFITPWAVALTSYISHSAKHMKMTDFDPSESQNPEPILMKLGIVDYVRHPTQLDYFSGCSATWVVWASHISWVSTDRDVKFAYSRRISRIADWMVWPPSLSRDRKSPRPQIRLKTTSLTRATLVAYELHVEQSIIGPKMCFGIIILEIKSCTMIFEFIYRVNLTRDSANNEFR